MRAAIIGLIAGAVFVSAMGLARFFSALIDRTSDESEDDWRRLEDEWRGHVETIDDGFGNRWMKCCHQCGLNAMEIVRPGKAQCAWCGRWPDSIPFDASNERNWPEWSWNHVPDKVRNMKIL
jgi:hypothetical protein